MANFAIDSAVRMDLSAFAPLNRHFKIPLRDSIFPDIK
jgi:hypothetical protein